MMEDAEPRSEVMEAVAAATRLRAAVTGPAVSPYQASGRECFWRYYSAYGEFGAVCVWLQANGVTDEEYFDHLQTWYGADSVGVTMKGQWPDVTRTEGLNTEQLRKAESIATRWDERVGGADEDVAELAASVLSSWLRQRATTSIGTSHECDEASMSLVTQLGWVLLQALEIGLDESEGDISSILYWTAFAGDEYDPEGASVAKLAPLRELGVIVQDGSTTQLSAPTPVLEALREAFNEHRQAVGQYVSDLDAAARSELLDIMSAGASPYRQSIVRPFQDPKQYPSHKAVRERLIQAGVLLVNVTDEDLIFDRTQQPTHQKRITYLISPAARSAAERLD